MTDGDDLPRETLFLLWAARETGVLDALAASAGTPAAVAEGTGVTPEAAETVVSALVDSGYLRRVGDEYEFTNRALGFLAKRDLRSIGPLPGALDDLDALVRLPETMRTGEPPERPPDRTRNRLGADLAADEAAVRARVTAAVREHPAATDALVLAGGSGVHAREFAARGLDVTLLDGPDVIAAVEPLLAPTDVSLVAGSLADVAERFDLVFGLGLCTELEAAEAEPTVAALADRLRPDGRLVLVETLADGSRAAVAAEARALAFGTGSGTHADADYREWFAAAGLTDVRVAPVPGTDRTTVTGRRPERTVQVD